MLYCKETIIKVLDHLRWRNEEDIMRQVIMVGSLLLATLFIGCGPTDQQQFDANKNLVRQMGATIDAAEWDALDALLTEDFRRHSDATTLMPEITSLKEFKRFEQTLHKGFPDMQVTYEEMVAEGDKVATYATFVGTNTGPLGETPATGRLVQVKFFAMFRIEEGKIAEIWVEWDNVSKLTQLGLWSAPSSINEE